MTGQPVRHTKQASWVDSDAWMEVMKGPRWKKTLDEEAALIRKALHEPSVQKRRGDFEKDYMTGKKKQETQLFRCGPAEVDWLGQFFKEWNFVGSETCHEARDLTSDGTNLQATQDIGNGAESFQLQCWKSCHEKKPSWTRFPVGPDVAIQGKTLQYLGVKNKLIYHELWCCDAETGENARRLQKERSPTTNLSLEKQPDGRILFIKEDSQDLEVQEIKDKKLHRIQDNQRHLIPEGWKVPKGEQGISFVWPRWGFLITKEHGITTLWKCSPKTKPVKVIQLVAGTIQFDPQASAAGEIPCLLRIEDPVLETAFWRFNGESFESIQDFPDTGLTAHPYFAESQDGTAVRGILVQKKNTKPQSLLMVGQGAQGMPTAIGSVRRRWEPLLQRGWVIGQTFLRGGGDHTDEWAKAGRREGRHKTIEDFEALIQRAQHLQSISPKKTAIQGRSAGGLLMGGTLTRNPTGKLMSAVYTEVPYVDELRTTTNNELPLTELEFNEFGAPAHRLSDFLSVGLLSPADAASTTGSPEVFVLTRTAENDSQVFAQESVKWIRRLRESSHGGAPKLCIVERGQGHFTPPERVFQQWSTDCALLDSQIQGVLR